jgi:hypothetical protein
MFVVARLRTFSLNFERYWRTSEAFAQFIAGLLIVSIGIRHFARLDRCPFSQTLEYLSVVTRLNTGYFRHKHEKNTKSIPIQLSE